MMQLPYCEVCTVQGRGYLWHSFVPRSPWIFSQSCELCLRNMPTLVLILKNQSGSSQLSRWLLWEKQNLICTLLECFLVGLENEIDMLD